MTFHPDAAVLENLAKAGAQVERLVVVDNGSSAEELEPLREAAQRLKFALVENGENLGIATALNRGIAQAGTAKYVLLLDQDSCMTKGFVAAMGAEFAGSRWGERLGILVPRYRDERLNKDISMKRFADGTLELAMTSGSLIPLSVIARHGGLLDGLFIDAVDYEYSLRLRKAGLVIDQCAGAVLLHSPGAPNRVQFAGLTFQSANYSPLRLYYQGRNSVWLLLHYGSRFPLFCVKIVVAHVEELIKSLLVEKDKFRKAWFFLRGVSDALLGRMGKLR